MIENNYIHIILEFGNIRDFKEQELALVGYVLTELKVPTIINFGAGHSIQEDVISRIELERLLSKFKNVILVVPSKDNDVSSKILSSRMTERYSDREQEEMQDSNRTNEHFIRCGYNERIATIVLETEGKDAQECANEILRLLHIGPKCQRTPIDIEKS